MNRTEESQQTPLLGTGGDADPILHKIHEQNLSQHLLSTGPRYEIDDIRCSPVAGLGLHTSGVLCMYKKY